MKCGISRHSVFRNDIIRKRFCGKTRLICATKAKAAFVILQRYDFFQEKQAYIRLHRVSYPYAKHGMKSEKQRREKSMQVKEIMTTNIAAVAPDSTVLEAAKAMQAHNIGCMPVCQPGGKIAGIVTDRDIVVRNIANNGDPKTSRIKDVMTKNVITAEPGMDVGTAADIMSKNKIRRLPVVQDGSVIGMIAIGDLATRNMFHTEAKEALSDISEPSKPMNMMQ